MVERWHRSLKAAITGHVNQNWHELFSIVLLGLLTAIKVDIRTRTANLVYGTTLRLPSEFLCEQDPLPKPKIFF